MCGPTPPKRRERAFERAREFWKEFISECAKSSAFSHVVCVSFLQQFISILSSKNHGNGSCHVRNIPSNALIAARGATAGCGDEARRRLSLPFLTCNRVYIYYYQICCGNSYFLVSLVENVSNTGFIHKYKHIHMRKIVNAWPIQCWVCTNESTPLQANKKNMPCEITHKIMKFVSRK